MITFDLGAHDAQGRGPTLVIADDQRAQLCTIRDALKDVPASDGAKVRQETLQRLLMELDEYCGLSFSLTNNIQLFAAWPRHWTDTFTLQAPKDTSITGSVKDGVLVELNVTPASRRKDVWLPGQNGLFAE